MKRILKKLVSWMTVLGNLCIFIGCFITFAKGYSWYYGEVDSVALFRAFESEGHDMMKGVLVVMWIAAIVSLVIISLAALELLDENTGLAASITLVIVAFVGNIVLVWLKKKCFL